MDKAQKKEFIKFGGLALVITLVCVAGGIALYHHSQKPKDEKDSDKEEDKG